VEIFIAGESYAGFYVPWIAEHIVQMQLVTAEDGTTTRVKDGTCVLSWPLCDEPR
jgi:carboxypeptidase C (cathepsin A)